MLLLIVIPLYFLLLSSPVLLIGYFSQSRSSADLLDPNDIVESTIQFLWLSIIFIDIMAVIYSIPMLAADWEPEISTYLWTIGICAGVSAMITYVPYIVNRLLSISSEEKRRPNPKVNLQDKQENIFIPYCITALLISLCMLFATNTVLLFIDEGILDFRYTFVVFAVIVLYYFWFISYSRRKAILTKIIKKVNGKITDSMQILKAFTESDSKGWRKYNKACKKVNRILSKNGIRKTFEPITKENTSVLKTVKLFSYICDEKLRKEYEKYKKLFAKVNGLPKLVKINKQANEEGYIKKVQEYMHLLSGTITKNRDELDLLNSSEGLFSVDTLAKKYSLFQNQKKKFVIAIVLLSIVLTAIVSLFLYERDVKNVELCNYVKNSMSEKNFDDAYYKLIHAGNSNNIKQCKYELAKTYFNQGNYNNAFGLFQQILGYENTAEYISKLRGKTILQTKYEQNKETASYLNEEIEKSRGDTDYIYTQSIYCDNYTVKLGKYGMVHIDDHTGGKGWKSEAEDWRDIVSICANNVHLVGLKSDGTVKSISYDGNSHLIKDENITETWEDIVAIAIGESGHYSQRYTVGLKSDGKLVVACSKLDLEYNMGHKDIKINVGKIKNAVAIFAYRDKIYVQTLDNKIEEIKVEAK